ncbi:MAG: RNA-binding S4 domain-containing protein [Bacteroidota bacterium]|nr:RNA-binding S4 domain-containing protein [Bacteroidota bacterium]
MNPTITFKLSQEFIPLIQLLKYVGIANTGSEASYLVDSGQVLCNNFVETRKRYKVKQGDIILVSNRKIEVVI